MLFRTIFPASLVAAGFLFGGALANGPTQANDVLALQELQANFHGASTIGDYDLLHSLWADDAVAYAAGGEYHGPDEIADFFSSGEYWGTATSLASTFKTNWTIRGGVAEIQFECVIVHTGALDPLTTMLSEFPFGEQNPDVEIVQHSTATVTAVRDGSRWLIQRFEGTPGPIL